MSDTTPREFTIMVPRTFKEGWGVVVTPIYDWDEETDQLKGISSIDVDVVRIDENTVEVLDGTPVVAIPDVYAAYMPVENFLDEPDLTVGDTHDLRTRWFPTEQAARDHAQYTRKRWDHPQIWESFVRLD